MNITLSPALERFVEEQVSSGHYVDASEVVRTAVRLLEVRQATVTATTHFAVLGSMGDGDIMAMAFVVMMEAAKSAQEDLKAIMAQVKAINSAKREMRELLGKVQRDCAANAAHRTGAALDFSRGLGSERAYHDAPVPHLDPDSPGGVRVVPTDLYPGLVSRTEDLCVVRNDLKANLDSLSEMGEMESLRLQMAMDRMSKMMSALSNLLKKQSDTANAITQNIK